MINVAIIGFGYSGKRFYNVINTRKEIKKDIDIVAICDVKPIKLEHTNNILICKDVKSIFTKVEKIDIIIVAVNEKYRFQIFKELYKYKKMFKIIISEKLLTENLVQAKSLLNMFEENDIFVHFVERFSPAIIDLYNWIKENKLMVKRANFFWGKNRLYDERPTIGVISEISHPLDLILRLSDFNYEDELTVETGNYVFSDYSSFNIDLLETINVSIKSNKGLFIYGNSSFLWNKRDRRISLFLSNYKSNEINYIVNITLDNPTWDNDEIEILELKNVPKKVIKIKEFYSKSVDNSLCGLNKIYLFIEEVINKVFYGENFIDALPNLRSSLYVQKLVDDILREACQKGYHFNIYNKK